MGKNQRPYNKVTVTAKDLRQLERKTFTAPSASEMQVLRRLSYEARALYLELAWSADRAGSVHGETYDTLRARVIDDDRMPIGRALLRSCLLELADVHLIVFDRSTPKTVDGVLRIVVPHQAEHGQA